MMLVRSTPVYLAIVVINSMLLVMLALLNSDFSVWFIVFEVSLVTGISTLTLESRSYRRSFALATMLAVTIVGSCSFCLAIGLSSVSLSSSWIAALLVSVIILVKLPS